MIEEKRPASWWSVARWRIATFVGGLTEGWWLGGGQLSYWKMLKLVWVAMFCVVVAVLVMRVIAGVVGDGIANIVFLILAIAVGGVVVGAFIWSWVQMIRGKS